MTACKGGQKGFYPVLSKFAFKIIPRQRCAREINQSVSEEMMEKWGKKKFSQSKAELALNQQNTKREANCIKKYV